MKGDLLSQTDLLLLPQIGVVLFVGVFVLAIVWAFRPGSRRIYEARGLMPLDDQTPVEPIDPSPKGPR